MNETKWLSLSMTKKELEMVNAARKEMEKVLGIRLSRNAFVKRLLFATMQSEPLQAPQ